MSPKDWEKAVAEDYWNYRWHQIMDPLCDSFQKWKAGELSNEAVSRAIDKAYEEKAAINSLLGQRQDRAAGLIRCWDPEWFQKWIAEHQPSAELPEAPCGS